MLQIRIEQHMDWGEHVQAKRAEKESCPRTGEFVFYEGKMLYVHAVCE